MKIKSLLVFSALAATPGLAEETRQLDAHEHGVGQLDIAVDGQQIAMEFHAPGADIVGFEYAAESAEDLAAIEKAIATLAKPLELFVVPAAAGCSVVEAAAELESEDSHDDHDAHGDEHADHDDHGHEERAEGHDDHDDHEDHGDEHAEHDDHDDHGEEHAEHDDHGEEHAEGHDDHGHEEHADEAGHTEFHAEYLLTCADATAVTDITFAYFDAFPNALEVEVQVVSDSGATPFEVERDAPSLDLSGL